MEENTISNVKDQQQNGDKITRNYETTMKKLVAVVGGKENLLPEKKVSQDVIETVVQGLLKEKKEILEKEVRIELAGLLDKHVELNKAFKQKEEEIKRLKETKMKEFNDAANKVFNKIDGIGKLEQDYYTSLSSLGDNTVDVKE